MNNPFLSILSGKKKNIDKPRFYVQWHLLDGCNLRCAHCYQNGEKRAMDFDHALQLLDQLDRYFEGKNCQPQINLTGGEPLLYPDLLPLIDRITERGWLWALLTNGTLLTKEMAKELKTRNPVFVQVSLEGPKDLNDACRGEGTFEKILQAVDILNDAGIKTLVSFTITTRNYRAFHETADICRQHHVHKLWCDRYVGNDELCLTTEQYQEFLETLKAERENSGSKLPVVSSEDHSLKSVLLKTTLQKSTLQKSASSSGSTIISAERSLQFMAGGNGYLCGCGKSLLVFLPDGTILPCRRLPLPLGNVFEIDSIEELLRRSALWEDLGKPLLSATCISCPDLKRCQGGAKCVTYAQTGRYHGTDINCVKKGKKGTGV